MQLKTLLLAILSLSATTLMSQTDTTKVERGRSLPDWFPSLSGTIRAKMEYQPNEGESRFEVRTARIALDGFVTPIIEYKAEIDLSDEGSIKMLDAYAGVLPVKGLNVRLGQMRVPFSIDAHRSPHKQYFANRSFIAKQVGNVRDVGLYVGYRLPITGLTIEGGVFNGSGLTDQKDYWTKEFNFSAKAQYTLPIGLTFQGSIQKISPQDIPVYLYDGGVTYQKGRWIAEVEYLRKHYSKSAFDNVDALDAFVAYEQPLKKIFTKISFLCRYDRMDKHSNGAKFSTIVDPDTNEETPTSFLKCLMQPVNASLEALR